MELRSCGVVGSGSTICKIVAELRLRFVVVQVAEGSGNGFQILVAMPTSAFT